MLIKKNKNENYFIKKDCTNSCIKHHITTHCATVTTTHFILVLLKAITNIMKI